MSHHHPPPLLIIFTIIFSLLPALVPALSNPDPASIQPFHPNSSPPATIPSFPEQSAFEGCPVHLPDELFLAVKSSCAAHSGQVSRTQCCPVIAAWLYSAYSGTALGKAGNGMGYHYQTMSYDMPLLPDDSETCVSGLEDAMRTKGVNLIKPNDTCDFVYCYCGIRLHLLSCPQAFRSSNEGKIVGDKHVSRLERDCLSKEHNGTRNALARCSKCLNSLNSLTNVANGSDNTTKSEARTTKMRSRDCQLMGLTWLLDKNRDAYISTVTAVMRALMLNSDDSDPPSCSLSSDGMPLAVDSMEINDQSSSINVELSLCFLSFVLLIMSSYVVLY